MRTEEYLQGILGALGAGEDVGVPKPVWRHEEFLKAIYDALSAGVPAAAVAKQLAATVGTTDSVPYTFRTSGGSADIGEAEEDRLVGGTVAWNQLLKGMSSENYKRSSSSEAEVSVADGVATVTALTRNGSMINGNANRPTIAEGHKVLCSVDVKLTTAAANAVRAFWNDRSSTGKYAAASTAWQTLANILQWDSSKGSIVRVADTRYSDWDAYQVKNCMMIDLTAMFGAAIADFVYGLEQSTPGAGVAWFKKLFPKAYYAYNAGTLLSVNASSHSMVGFNAYDHASGTARVVGGMQYEIVGPYTALSLGGVSITPDGSGKFTPSDSGALTVTGGSADATCVHLVWDGERDGEYRPYEKHTYALDGSLSLRGIPKLDGNNKLCYDGDVYECDGTVTRQYGIRAFQAGDATDGSTMITDGTNTVYKLDSAVMGSAAPFDTPQWVDDFGTEEYAVTEQDGVAVPVGHETLYRTNLRAKLEMAPDSPDGDGDYIVRQTNGQNAYVPFSEVKELPPFPAGDGTYRLQAAVSGDTVTLSWASV